MRAPSTTAPSAAHRSTVLTQAVLRAAEILGLNQAALAEVLGVSPATVTRMAQGDYELREGGKEWELAALLVRLYRGLDAMMAADEEALLSWVNSLNNDLQAVPASHIRTVQGLVDTVEYVDAYRARV